MSEDELDEELYQGKSKSQIKREMKTLQLLGKRLTELPPGQLAKMPLDEDLVDALADYKRTKTGEALRRQLHFIGRLLRGSDIEAIQARIKGLDDGDAESRWKFDRIEQYREKLLADKDYLTEFFQDNPHADVQHLRQLIRNSLKEQASDKDQGGKKKLFRYLRKLIEDQTDESQTDESQADENQTDESQADENQTDESQTDESPLA